MTDLIPSAGTRRYDVLVIGAGIVGLATAEAIQRVRPDLSMAILEKEVDVGMHQTGRNSGVIHAGLYYEPGSLKAALSVAGGPRLFEFCEANNIPTTQTGKVVVATDRAQVPRLDELERRARANGVDIRRMGSAELSEREPHARGVDALWVPFTGAVDFGTVAAVLADQLRAGGAEILTRFRVRQATRVGTDWVLSGSRSPISGRVVINCAGLHVDRVARLFGVDPGLRILPFRGEYYSLNSEAANLIRAISIQFPTRTFLTSESTSPGRSRGLWRWVRTRFGPGGERLTRESQVDQPTRSRRSVTAASGCWPDGTGVSALLSSGGR